MSVRASGTVGIAFGLVPLLLGVFGANTEDPNPLKKTPG